MDLRDDLYNTMLNSPLGVVGVEQTLPALEDMLKELRMEEFWADKRRRRRLSEEQMIRAWAEYRRELKALRERIRQRQQNWDDLLSWLVIFIIEHYRELACVSAIYEPKFQLAFDRRGDIDPEDDLAMRDDWQRWIVDWLRDALRDEDLEATPFTTGDGQRGSDDGDPTPAPHNLRHDPDSDSSPEIEF